MIYALIVYAVSVIFWGTKNYLIRINLPFWTKMVHIVIAFILFQYYFGNFRQMLWNFFRNGFKSFQSTTEYYAFNKPVDFSLTVLFFVVSFFVAGLSLNIAVRAKSRKLLLISSPIIIIVTSLDLYKYSIVESGLIADSKTFFAFLISVTVIFVAINLFYNLKPGKNIFILSQQDMPE